MRDSDIKRGLYVKVKGRVGVVGKCSVDGFCGDDLEYRVDFTMSDGVSTISWWVTADEIEPVRGV